MYMSIGFHKMGRVDGLWGTTVQGNKGLSNMRKKGHMWVEGAKSPSTKGMMPLSLILAT